MYKKASSYNFADVAIDHRKINESFFEKINKIVNWKKINTIIETNYNKGKRFDGRPAYSGLLLFKIYLIEKWYDIPKMHLESCLNNSISFTHFLGLSLADEIPSISTFSNFRYEMDKKGLLQSLYEEIETQLLANNLKVKPGCFREPKLSKA